jgi:putative transposase
LGVKSNNYYSYQKIKTLKPFDTTQKKMLVWVKDIAKFSDNTYGERHIQKALNTFSLLLAAKNSAVNERGKRLGML